MSTEAQTSQPLPTGDADDSLAEDGAAPPSAAPRRIVICLDGTWNNPAKEKERDDGDKVFKPTNVLKTCRAIKSLDDATATLIFSGQPSDGETVALDGRTYTFQSQLTDEDGHVQIGDTVQKSLENLSFAINRRRSRGRYSASTTLHPTAEARAVAGDRFSIEITARKGGPAGDPFATGETLARGYWARKNNLAQAYRDRGLDPTLGIPQIAYYDLGVGGSRKFSGASNAVHRTIDKAFGGAAGAGFEANIEDAYTFLSMNYGAGDEIFLFGFSRGAATARGLARFIDWMGGILPPRDSYWIPRYFDAFLAEDSFSETRAEIHAERVARALADGLTPEKAEEKAIRIVGTVTPARVKFLGVWDTVLSLSDKRERPHFGPTPPALVDHARQGLAIDEKRPDFLPKVWEGPAANNPDQTLQQRWFAGVHTNIGGGYVNDGLGNVSLRWMLNEARDAGLGLDWEFLSSYAPYPQDQLYASDKGVWKALHILTLGRRRGTRDIAVSQAAGLTIHGSALQRLASPKQEDNGRVHDKLEPYRPKNLLQFLAAQPNLDAFLASIPDLPEDFELTEEARKAIEEAR